MAKFLLLLKQYWVVAVAGVAIGGFAVSSMSGGTLIGAADGKKNLGGSVNDLLRETQKKGKKSARPNRASAAAPTSEDLGVGASIPEDILRPVELDQPLLDPHNPEQCARHTTPSDSSHPYTTGEVRRVRYVDMNHYHDRSDGNVLECLIAVYPKGCEGFVYYSVLTARNQASGFNEVSRNLCKSAERALLKKTPVAVSGVLVPSDNSNPGAMHKKLVTFELGSHPIER